MTNTQRITSNTNTRRIPRKYKMVNPFSFMDDTDNKFTLIYGFYVNEQQTIYVESNNKTARMFREI